MQRVKKVCPDGCHDTTFGTTAHVMQDWEVDGSGEFVGIIKDCLQITHHPHPDNTWTCMKCGSSAVNE